MSNIPKEQVPWKGDVISMKKWRSILTHEYKPSKP